MRIEYREQVALLRMEMGKAKAMGPSLLNALKAQLDELAAHSASCLIITGYDRHFSAGLNLPELLPYNREQMAEFFKQFATTFVRIAKLPQIVIAAINGNAIAGGAILAQLADYRIMARGDVRIGANEINLGIPFPHQALEILKQRLPAATYFDAIYRGQLFTPDEALQRGFVDELCEADALEARALGLGAELAAKGEKILARTKKDLAIFNTAKLESLIELNDAEFESIWFSEETRNKIGTLVASLKAKKS